MLASPRRRAHAAACAAVATCAVLASASGAAAAEVNLSGPNVIRYDQTGALENSSRTVVNGKRTESGCAFELTRHLRPGDAVRDRELAYDPDTCTSLRETGTLPASELAAYKTAQTTGDGRDAPQVTRRERLTAPGADDGQSASSAAADGVAAAASFGRFYGFVHGWYEDPPGFHVSDDTAGVNWEPDGICAYPSDTGGYSLHDGQLDWLEETGWYLESDLFLDGLECGRAYTDYVSHMKNTLFCVPWLDTHTVYDLNQFEGLPDASGNVWFSYQHSGDCGDLLSSHIDYAIYQTA